MQQSQEQSPATATSPEQPHPKTKLRDKFLCRRCGSHFRIQDKLDRHVSSKHSRSGSKQKDGALKNRVQRDGNGVHLNQGERLSPTPQTGDEQRTERDLKSSVHPFTWLSRPQQLAFAFYCLYVLFMTVTTQMQRENTVENWRNQSGSHSWGTESQRGLEGKRREWERRTSLEGSDDESKDGGIAINDSMLRQLESQLDAFHLGELAEDID